MVDNVIPPLRGEPLFDAQGNPTIRFAEFLDRMAVEVNEIISTSDSEFTLSLGGKLAALQAQIGSGDALTSDETGFTVDSSKLSVDMTEA